MFRVLVVEPSPKQFREARRATFRGRDQMGRSRAREGTRPCCRSPMDVEAFFARLADDDPMNRSARARRQFGPLNVYATAVTKTAGGGVTSGHHPPPHQMGVVRAWLTRRRRLGSHGS